MDCSTSGFPVLHYLQEFAQTHVHWVNDAIKPSHPLPSPSPTALSLSQHQGLFQWVSFSHQAAKVLELQHQSFPWKFRVDFILDWLVRSCSPRDSQESSPVAQFERINSLALSIFYGPLSHLHMTAGKTIALTIQTFVGQVMSLLFNTLSKVHHSFSSKEQASFNFVAVVLSDFPRK